MGGDPVTPSHTPKEQDGAASRSNPSAEGLVAVAGRTIRRAQTRIRHVLHAFGATLLWRERSSLVLSPLYEVSGLSERRDQQKFSQTFDVTDDQLLPGPAQVAQ